MKIDQPFRAESNRGFLLETYRSAIRDGSIYYVVKACLSRGDHDVVIHIETQVRNFGLENVYTNWKCVFHRLYKPL